MSKSSMNLEVPLWETFSQLKMYVVDESLYRKGYNPIQSTTCTLQEQWSSGDYKDGDRNCNSIKTNDRGGRASSANIVIELLNLDHLLVLNVMRQVVYKLLELYCGHIKRESAAQCIALCCTMQLIEKFSPKCSFIKRKVYLHIVDKKMGRITWVCTTCSQNFTRKFSANRHNKNSHSGRAVIVRLLD